MMMRVSSSFLWRFALISDLNISPETPRILYEILLTNKMKCPPAAVSTVYTRSIVKLMQSVNMLKQNNKASRF